MFVTINCLSMYIQSQLCSLSSVILSNLYSLSKYFGNAFVAWKAIYKSLSILINLFYSNRFLRISCLRKFRIDFKMHVQIQPHNCLLVTAVESYIFVLILWESICRLGNNLVNIIEINNLFYPIRFTRELSVVTILKFIRICLPFIVFIICAYF